MPADPRKSKPPRNTARRAIPRTLAALAAVLLRASGSSREQLRRELDCRRDVDITGRKRKRVEEALRRREEDFRWLTQNSSDIITVLDADGTILYQRQSGERVLGYCPEDRIGKNVVGSRLVHPDDLTAKRDFITRAVNNLGATALAAFRRRPAGGSWRHIEALGRNLLHDLNDGGLVANYRDVSERKRA